MALVQGPLFSEDASGTIAGALTYSKWKGRNYVRNRVDPKNPKSARQVGVRSMMQFLAKTWAGIAALSQSTWDALAASKQISAFNAFVGFNLARWQNFQGPTEENPAAEASTPLTISAHTYTGGSAQVTLSLTASGTTALQGIAIFRDTSAIVTTDWSKCIHILPCTTVGPHVWVDSPLVAGTYHYRACTVQTDGVLGTILADDTGVAT